MKVRGTTAGEPRAAKLTALCWGALTLLALVAVSACTSSSTSSPTVFTPSVHTSPNESGTTSASASNTTSASNTASSGTSKSPGSTSSPTSTPAHAAPGPTPTPTPTATASATGAAAQPTTTTSSPGQVPTQAPITGGGGTAGFQNTLLLGLGAVAILVGAGGIAYRRRVSRHR